ncbi:hypothetical protein ACJW8B_13900 [Plesiomonas shigelloides]|nr:hypothetical protein GBN23_12710 [Plesiomonas shigelloides]KAB7687462.1 hypothetical protein GBN28_12145 [Plesiomonas shigelloides]KAB7694708.1 hypothetical protein GBN33_16265 [Plesiomonas shigelloides]
MAAYRAAKLAVIQGNTIRYSLLFGTY